MQKTDKNRILNFLLGYERTSDFEKWVYNDIELETRIGTETYHELIGANYKDNDVRYNLKSC